MSYNINIKDFSSTKVILTTIKGKLSETERDRVAKETIKFCRKNNLSRIIWDVREANLTYSLIGSHLVVKKFKEFGVLKSDRIIILYKNDAQQHRHTSIATMNRGINNIMFFTDMEEGMRWLLEL